MNTYSVKLNLFSIENWRDKDIESLILLLDKQSAFRPDNWGPYEPLKFTFSRDVINNAQVRWKSKRGVSLLFGKNKYNVSIMVVHDWAFGKPNWITVSLVDTFFADDQQTETFLEFVKQLFKWGKILYGYACHRLDFERKNKLPVPTHIEGKLIATGGMDIRRCLPGIYWANFFGGQYVNWFGKGKFQNLPVYTSEDLPQGGQLVLTSRSPLDYGQIDVMERERLIRKQLGESAFFDIQNPTLISNSPFKDGSIQIE